MLRSLIPFFAVLIGCVSFAGPLGTVPVIEESNLRLIGDFTSDLWTNPVRDKSSPIRIYNLKTRIPVIKRETWSTSLSLEMEGLSLGRSDLTLGEDRVFLGSDFRDQRILGGYNLDLGDQSSINAFAGMASASDQPFGAARDQWVEGVFVYRGPQVERHQWIVLVNQTNDRGFNNGSPFPYFGVLYQVSPTLTIVGGFPFLRVTWLEQTGWRMQLVATPVNFRAEAVKPLRDDFEGTVRAGWDVRSYLHANRIENDERIFFEDKYFEFGVKRDLSSSTTIQFGFGASFNRRIYAASTINQPELGVVKLDRDFYARLGIEFRP